MQGFAAALSGTGPDGKPVEPIAFQTLQTHLPKVSGWEMDEPEGQRMTMPVPFSQVETEYRNGDKRVDVTIVDTGFAKRRKILDEPLPRAGGARAVAREGGDFHRPSRPAKR